MQVHDALSFGRAADALRRRVARAARGPGSYTRPDVTYSHVSDIPPNQVCLAWDAARRSQLIQDFAAIAADHPPVASQAEPGRVSPAEPKNPAELFGRGEPGQLAG